MPTKTKGRSGGDRATTNISDKFNHTFTASCIKALIVGAASLVFLSVKLAHWLIQRGGLSNA